MINFDAILTMTGVHDDFGSSQPVNRSVVFLYIETEEKNLKDSLRCCAAETGCDEKTVKNHSRQPARIDCEETVCRA